jgi:tRNA pseudouridine38-40 synthase
MNYSKATIQYAGTNHAGFQFQNQIPTIQNEINKALKNILGGKVTTVGASRTDSGVHAFEQIIKITSENIINNPNFLKLFNDILPEEIRCLDISSCTGDFRPTVESTSKEYRYLFTNKAQIKANECKFVANIANPLDLNAMIICVQAIIGMHDFCNFYSAGSNVKTTVRDIYICELSEINPHDIFYKSSLFQIPENLDKCYQIKIEANGFLKQMIRHIVSALWMVGSGKLSTDQFISLLAGFKVNKQLWKVAPPNGLYLYKIKYSSNTPL